MPFINIHVQRRRLNPFLILLNQLMIVSCDDIITLSATVGPGTYLWEQLSGNTVTWLTPLNELEATFQQTLVRDDKVFRFWVNKNTINEAYADVLVTAVPREYIPEIRHATFNDRFFANEETTSSLMVPGLSAEGTATLNNPLRGLFFTDPTASNIVEYKVYDVTGGISETLVAQFPPPARSYFNLASSKNYRVDTTVNKNGILHDATGGVASFYPPAGWLDIDTFDRGTVHATKSNSPSSLIYERFVYEVVPIVPGVTAGYDADTALVVMQSTNQLDNTYTRYPLSLQILPTVDDEIYSHMLDNNFSASITRQDLGIGGIG